MRRNIRPYGMVPCFYIEKNGTAKRSALNPKRRCDNSRDEADRLVSDGLMILRNASSITVPITMQWASSSGAIW